MDDDDSESAKQRGRMGWLMFPAGCILTGVVAGVAGLSAYRSGELVGRTITFGLLVILVTFILRASEKSPESKATRTFWAGIVFLVVCAGVLTTGILSEKQRLKDVAALQARMDKLVDTQGKLTNDPTTPVKAPDGPLPTISAGQTTLQKVGVLIDRTTQRTIKIGAAYQKALADAKYTTLLTPATLSSATERANAREHLSAMNTAITTWQNEMNNSIVESGRDFSEANIPEPDLTNMKTGFDKGVANSKQFVHSFVEVERSLTDVIAQVLTVADTDKPRLGATGKQLLFTTQAAADRFNELMAQVRKLASQENALLHAQTEHLKTIRDAMNRGE